ncbi:Ig-like domain-containing protein [Deinococcota bacterium DY0809b]
MYFQDTYQNNPFPNWQGGQTTQVGALLSGRIYEDVVGDGTVTGDSGANGVAVELYESGGTNLASTTSASYNGEAGWYAFPVPLNSTRYVVVDSRTVSPSAGFNAGFDQDNVWAEQTYGAGGSWGGVLCDSDADPSTQAQALSSSGACFGGRTGNISDDASSFNTAEHVAEVSISSSDVSNVDFGFSFNVVTNTNDQDDDQNNARTAQGSLRQFLQNANAIAGGNVMRFVPAVPTNASAGGGSWWGITVNKDNLGAYPTITDGATTIDGVAYDYTNGTLTRDTNAGSISAPGPVGVSETLLTGYAKPELEVNVNDAGVGLTVASSNTKIARLALYNSEPNPNAALIQVTSGNSNEVRDSFLGPRADGSDPQGDDRARVGVTVESGAAMDVVHNYVAYLYNTGVELMGTGTVKQNFIEHIGMGAACGDGISFEGGPARNRSDVVVQQNYIRYIAAYGVESWGAPGAYTVRENTITRTGTGGSNGDFCGGSGDINTTERGGIRIFGPDSLVEKNVVHAVPGHAVVVVAVNISTPSKANTISQNIFYNNGGLSIDLDQTHQYGTGGSVNPNGDGVTPNDGQTSSSQQNAGLDYPIFTQAQLHGSTLHVEGYVGTSSQHVAGTHTVEVYKADDDGNNNGEVVSGVNQSEPHGEGHWYIGSCTTQSDGTFACDLTVPSDIPLSSSSPITGTATASDGSTSEFGANALVTPVNDPPTATDDSYTTDEDTSLTVDAANGVLANDSDPDGDTLTVTALTWDTDGDGTADTVTVGTATDVYDSSGTLAGQLTINADGSLDFTPASNYNGTVDGITYTVSDGNGGADSAQVTITVNAVPDADLSLTKTVNPASTGPGDTVTFTITVTNDGPDTATGVEVTDQLPSGYTYVSSNPSQGSYDSATGKWSGLTLASGANATLTITATVNASGDHTNTAEVTASDAADPDSTPGNNDPTEDDYATAEPSIKVSLLLQKEVDREQVRYGDLITYTLRVHNPSSVDAHFNLTDHPDPYLQYVAGSASPVQPTVSGGTLRWAGLQLGPGETLVLTYEMRVLAGASGELRNVARVAPAEGGPFAVQEAEAHAQVKAVEEVFNRRNATLAGRVYLDVNRNRSFDEGVDIGLPGARVLLANGMQATTDMEGRYAFRDLEGGVWMVQLDALSAPFPPEPHPEAMGDGYTHRVPAWGLTVSDFPLEAPAGTISAVRETTLVYGPLTVQKKAVPLDEGRFRVALYVQSDAPLEQLVLTDPLPGGGERVFDLGRFQGEKTLTYELEGRVVLTDPNASWRYLR